MEIKSFKELNKMSNKERKQYFLSLPDDMVFKAISEDIRHSKRGNTPSEYLFHWLTIARCFGYATEDDSWGELEKLLNIFFTNYIQNYRTMHPNSVDFINN